MSKFNIWILDPDEQLQAVASNRGSALPILDAHHKQQLLGENSLTFYVPSDHADASYIVENGIIIFRDADGIDQEFVVKEIEEEHGENGNSKRIYCDHVSGELMDAIVPKYEANKADIATMLGVILGGTRWQVGLIDPLETLTHTFYMKDALHCIDEIVAKMGVEFRFRVQFTGNMVTGRYVDCMYQLGEETGKRFEYEKDLLGVRKTVDIYDRPTALVGLGKTTEEKLRNDENEKLTFADIEWSKKKGDPRDKPKGQIWVGDEGARENHGIPNGSGGRLHRIKLVEFSDIEVAKELLSETNKMLDKAIVPNVTYDMNVIDLERASGLEHEAVRLGDSVTVIDRKMVPQINIKARIVEIERDLLHAENTRVILGNFIDIFGPEDELNRLKDRAGTWDGSTKPGDRVKTKWLDGVIDALQNEVYGGAGTVRLQDDGMLILDRPADRDPQRAILLNNGILAIANQRVSGGDPATAAGWNWRTFGTGDGFTADLINAGTLNASLVNVVTESGDKSSRVSMQNGNVYSYVNGQLSMRYGSYRLELYDYRNQNGGMLGFIGAGYSVDDESRRGLHITGEKDFVWIGRISDGLIKPNFLTQYYGAMTTSIAGPDTPRAASGIYTSAGIYSDSRIVGSSSTTPTRGQPCVVAEKGNNTAGTYLSDVVVYAGDLEHGDWGKFIVKINNANSESTKEMLRVTYNRVYFGAENVVQLIPFSNAFRLGVGDKNYIRLFDNGQLQIIADDTIRHVFYPNGQKQGGSIEIGDKVWGMSPIDSPRVLIEDVIFDQEVNEDGVLVELEERYAQSISMYAVFPCRGDVVVTNKTDSSFIIKGSEGIVDIRIVGVRRGEEATYWKEMPVIDPDAPPEPMS